MGVIFETHKRKKMKNNRIKKPKKKNIYEEEKEEFWRMNCEEEEPSGGITRSKDKESKYRRKFVQSRYSTRVLR